MNPASANSVSARLLRFYPLFLIGFISILSQVALLRELSVAFYGVELIYILAMGVWLMWTAAGAVLGRRRFIPSPTGVHGLFLLFAILLPVEIAFTRSLRLLFGTAAGAYLSFGLQILGMLLILLPIGLLLGLVFQWAAKIHIREGGGLAQAYAVESAGGLVGGLTATLLLYGSVQNFTIAVICSLSAAGALAPSQPQVRPRTRFFAVLISLILAGMWVQSDAIDRRMTRWKHPYLIAVQDSPYSRITISGRTGQYVVFENDALGFETESPAAEEFVHLAALQSRRIERVLVAGGGIEGILQEVLKYRPARIDYVELNRDLLTLMEHYLPDRFTRPLDADSVTVIVDDPRRFLDRASVYDLILVGMPEPVSGAANRFYTQEFFRSCARHLTAHGVLAFRLSTSENLWTPFMSHRNAAIYLALQSAFEDVLVLPGLAATFIASRSSLIRDPEPLARRWKKRNIDSRLVGPEYIHYLYTNDRFLRIADRLARTSADPNTDRQPVSYRYSSMIWLSQFFPGLIHREISTRAQTGRWWIPGGMGLFLALFCFLIRKKPRLRRFSLVFLAGFIGMVLETMLLLYYQAKIGALFQNIGLLLTLFMAGLVVGAAAVTRLAETDQARLGTVRRGLGIYLLLGFAALILIFWNLLQADQKTGTASISVLLFLNGFFVSGLFAYASLAGVKSQHRVVSPLYAADLLGGCLGSVLGSLWLAPFWGMGPTAFFLSLLSGAAFFLL